MKFLVQFGSCVVLAALTTFPAQAQSGGWYWSGGSGFWVASYAPSVPLFVGSPACCAPAYSVQSPMAMSAVSYGADFCCAPQCCNPCANSCGTGCSSGSCAGCEPGTGTLKPNPDENFRRKSPLQDSDTEDSPRDRARDRDLDRDRDPDLRKTREPADEDEFKRYQPRGRTPGGTGAGGQSEGDFPADGDTKDLRDPPASDSPAGGSGSTGSGSTGSGGRPDAETSDDLFDVDPIIRTNRPPMTEPHPGETSGGPKSGISAPAGKTDDFAPSGTESTPDGVAPTGDSKDFLPIEEPSGAAKGGPGAGTGAGISPSGRRTAGVASQLREVIPFARLAVADRDSKGERQRDATSVRAGVRWISVPMKAGHTRL